MSWNYMKKLEVVFCNSSFDDNYGEGFQCTLVWENNDELKERMKIIYKGNYLN